MKYFIVNLLLLLSLLTALPRAGAGQPTAAPVTILFVGNSFTHGQAPPVLNYNAAAITDENFGLPPNCPRSEHSDPTDPKSWGGIPGIFKKLTAEAGLRYEVHIEAASGMPLKFHYDSALQIIRQPRWQVVVLQEYSTWPVPARHDGHPDLFLDYATRLERAVHAVNPSARLYLYETWARADLTYPPAKPYSGLPIDSMTQDLHAGYYRLLRQNGRFAGLAPAGDAWLRAIRTGVALGNPYSPEPAKLDLWGADHYHPSRWGAYLNACVLFAEITGRDPRTFGSQEQAAADLGIAPAAALSLQRIAYEPVTTARKSKAATPATPIVQPAGRTKSRAKANAGRL